MPSQKNIQLLDEIKQKVDKATAMFFIDYSGLTHKQMEEARRELKNIESEMAVMKNTLLNLALKDKKIDVKEKLQGPHATLFSYKDPMATIKILANFIKKYGLPKIRFGIFEGNVIDEAMVTKLSTIPSREVLLGKLVGLLKSPVTGLVYNLNYNISKFVFVLKAIEDKRKSS